MNLLPSLCLTMSGLTTFPFLKAALLMILMWDLLVVLILLRSLILLCCLKTEVLLVILLSSLRRDLVVLTVLTVVLPSADLTEMIAGETILLIFLPLKYLMAKVGA